MLVLVDQGAFQECLQVGWGLAFFAFDAFEEGMAVELGQDVGHQVLGEVRVFVFGVEVADDCQELDFVLLEQLFDNFGEQTLVFGV